MATATAKLAKHGGAKGHPHSRRSGKGPHYHKPQRHNNDATSWLLLPFQIQRHNSRTIAARQSAMFTTYGNSANEETTRTHSSTTAASYTLPLSHTSVPHTHHHNCAKSTKNTVGAPTAALTPISTPNTVNAHNATITATPHTPLHTRYHCILLLQWLQCRGDCTTTGSKR